MSQYDQLSYDGDAIVHVISGPGTDVIHETANFDKFTTVDWITEEDRPLLNLPGERDFLNNGFRKYRQLLWERSRTGVTLTIIAVTIGCLAGFLQIFTETLVNWKTGHCARNWLLNKSFCCSEIQLSNVTRKRDLLFYSLSKREELNCVDRGLWIRRSGYVFPFITFISLSLVFSLISTLLVKFFAPMATGSGISEIKVWVSGFKYQEEFFSVLTLLVKSIALPLTISSGLSVGKEGPSVHYAACVGYTIANWLLRDVITFSQQSEYLTAASAAGVAVAFGTPIGGVLFGLEEIASSTEFSSATLWKSYYVALGAVATLKYINPFRNGMIVLFNVTYDKYWIGTEIPIFIILGIFGGLYGKYVSKWNILYVQFRRDCLSNWPVQEVIILTFVTSFVSYFNEFLKLDMTESMGILFHECTTGDNESPFQHRLCQLDENTGMLGFWNIITSLVFATIFRTIMVVMSYGALVPAGIFVPSMAIGATFGRALSLFVERFISGAGVITPGSYAFLGAAAALSGITNLTITVVVIMFELTGAFIYIIPTMIVVAITRLVMEYEGVTGGIADQMILVNGFPYLEYEKDDTFMNEVTAREIMTKDLKYISETVYLSELKSLVYSATAGDLKGFPIVKDNDKIEPEKRSIGYVLKKHLVCKLITPDSTFTDPESVIVCFTEPKKNKYSNSEGLHLLDYSDIVNTSPVTVKPNVPASLLFRMFKQLGCKTIIIESDGLIEGLITRKDLLRYERSKHKELFGSVYIRSPFLHDTVWLLIKNVIDKFT